MAFEVITPSAFGGWLAAQSVSRTIRLIQLHHTAAPDYAAWNKRPDALYWQNSMKAFHVGTRGFADIAQHFTITPAGEIVTGRSLDKAPAGITGANTGAVCIEDIGNFDSDRMTAAERDAIVTCTGELMKRFGLSPATGVTYHAWWTAAGVSLGTYIAGRSAKTCPGTGFFGGNTRTAYEAELMPLLANYINGTEDLTMTQYEELKSAISEVSAQLSAINAQLAERVGYYNYIDENMPESYKPTIEKLVSVGVLKGNESGELMLTIDMMRILTVLDRAGVFD